MNRFEIIIASPPDRERLVAEIWHNNILVAEINQEAESLEIELYKNEKLIFNLNEFLLALEDAKKALLK